MINKLNSTIPRNNNLAFGSVWVKMPKGNGKKAQNAYAVLKMPQMAGYFGVGSMSNKNSDILKLAKVKEFSGPNILDRPTEFDNSKDAIIQEFLEEKGLEAWLDTFEFKTK
jgi:hypothetical protein